MKLSLINLCVFLTLTSLVHCTHNRRKHHTRSKSVFHLTVDPLDPDSKAQIKMAEDLTSAQVITNWTQLNHNRRKNHKQKFARFNPDDGEVTILKRGPYMIYASIGFNYDVNRHGISQYLINVDDVTVLKCQKFGTFEHQTRKPGSHKTAFDRINVCKIDGTFYLYRNQTVKVTCGNSNVVIVPDVDVSFWGLVRL